jgi:ketosteroid isomerase-like protein
VEAADVSEANVETLRRIYEAWGRGEFAEGSELYDPHIVLVLRPEFAESGPHYGRDAIRKYMREDFLLDLDRPTISGEEFLEAGDSVVVAVHQQGMGPRSGAPVDMRYFQLWTFRAGTVIRIECIMERDDALEAAGLTG